jgi:SAM-dependent methyltransferase
MKHRYTRAIRRLLPESAVEPVRGMRNALLLPRRIAAERTFSRSSRSPIYLGADALRALHESYSVPAEYGYDKQSLLVRGQERARQVLGLPGVSKANSFLEIGCWDGMVSGALCREGRQVTAVDTREEAFDARASRQGVSLLKADASDMPFDDQTFDCVFAFDVFEHVGDPEAVLREAARVVRRGGVIFLQFGSLYMSPFGLHAYRSITIPYCQFLFPRSLMDEFVDERGLPPIDYDQVNCWAPEDYRKLWRQQSSFLKTLTYRETTDLSHVGLIREHPSCFRSESESFEDFIVSGIRVLFQRAG